MGPSLTAGAAKTGVLNLYANDAAGSKPGTALFTSASFPLANGYNTVNITGISGPVIPLSSSQTVPGITGTVGNLTWAVTFSGLTPGESAGLLIYEKPTIGNSTLEISSDTAREMITMPMRLVPLR